MKMYQTPEYTAIKEGFLLSVKDLARLGRLLGYDDTLAGTNDQVEKVYELIKDLTPEQRTELGQQKEAERNAKKEVERNAKKAAQEAKDLALKNKIENLKSNHKDIRGLELSKLMAGDHPRKEFWEKHWQTEEQKEQTRYLLACEQKVLALVAPELPRGHIGRYKLVARKKPRHETFFEGPPMPSYRKWCAMSLEEREEAIANNPPAFQKCGITAQETKGISARHLYEVFHTSRNDSMTMEKRFRKGVELKDVELNSQVLELVGLESTEDFFNLPLNVIKGVISAVADKKVSHHWAGRRNKGPDMGMPGYKYNAQTRSWMDRDEEFYFYKSLARGEFEALEVEYEISINPTIKAAFRRWEDNLPK